MIERLGEDGMGREDASYNRALLVVFVLFENLEVWILGSYNT